MTPRMQAAWEQMRAFEKKYRIDGPPSQCWPLFVDAVEFYPARNAYILACDEFYKASREHMKTASPDVASIGVRTR